MRTIYEKETSKLQRIRFDMILGFAYDIMSVKTRRG